MDGALRNTALGVRAAMPCSVELPAGTGKTHLVAALAAAAAEQGERTLILTHTNAGVDVLRGGAHEGCTAVPGRGCREHLATYDQRVARLRAALAAILAPLQ